MVAEDFLCIGWGGAICDKEDEDEERVVEDCCIDDDIVVGEAIGAFIFGLWVVLVLVNEG